MTISSFYWLPNVLCMLFDFVLIIPLGGWLGHLHCLDAENGAHTTLGICSATHSSQGSNPPWCICCGVKKNVGSLASL